MINAEFNPEANVAPGQGDEEGDIVPSDEGVYLDTGRWPRIDKRLGYENEAAYFEMLMAETDTIHTLARIAERGYTSAHVEDRTDRDVPQPLDLLVDAEQIARNDRGLAAVKKALEK